MTVKCAYRYCGIQFVPQRHNQVYCCAEHTREETKIRLRESYHKNRDRQAGKKRKCATPGCGTVLSRYNPDDICGKCEAERRADYNRKMSSIRNMKFGNCLREGPNEPSE